MFGYDLWVGLCTKTFNSSVYRYGCNIATSGEYYDQTCAPSIRWSCGHQQFAEHQQYAVKAAPDANCAKKVQMASRFFKCSNGNYVKVNTDADSAVFN